MAPPFACTHTFFSQKLTLSFADCGFGIIHQLVIDSKCHARGDRQKTSITIKSNQKATVIR